jgi:hypothetical protein
VAVVAEAALQIEVVLLEVLAAAVLALMLDQQEHWDKAILAVLVHQHLQAVVAVLVLLAELV